MSSGPLPATVPTTPRDSPVPGPRDSSPQGAAASHTFQTKDHRLQLQYGPDWVPTPSDDYVLMLVPRTRGGNAPASAPSGSTAMPPTSITLDVPDLPFHLPGMITINRVRNGFVDDLKKQAGPSLKVREELVGAAMPGTNARRLSCTWQSHGASREEDALLMIHSDRVYILKFDSSAGDVPAVRDAFERIIASLQWR